MAPRTGRPRIDNPRTNQVHIRFTDEELAAAETAAARAGRPLTAWMRDTINRATKRTNKPT